MIAQLFASQHLSRTFSPTSIMSGTGNPALFPPQPEAMAAMISRGPSPSEDLEGYLDHRVASSKILASPDYPTPEATVRAQFLGELARRLMKMPSEVGILG